MTAVLEDPTLVVREVFYAVQGEGGRAGMASVFVRFAGCNLNCWFCDTDWQQGDRLTLAQVLALVRAAHGGTDPGGRFVVLTGGEPTVAPAFDALVTALKAANYRVQVETNGTRWRETLPFCYVTVSPKGKWEGAAAELDPGVVALPPTEYKYVVEDGDPLPVIPCHPTLIEHVGLFVQPRYDSRAAWEHALNLVRTHPRWRLSLQLHKWLGCR